MNTKIPKRIIQIAGGKASNSANASGKGSNLSTLARASAANLRLLNPEFEYELFDDVKIPSLMGGEFSRYRQVFDSFQLDIQRYDFFRYLMIYHYGGFYFDLDVLTGTSLDELLDYTCVFPFDAPTINRLQFERFGMDWDVGNYAFGATPRHPFLGAIIENCIRAQKDPKWARQVLSGVPYFSRAESHVMYTTGPGMISWTLGENPQLASSVSVLFPEDKYERSNWSQFGQFGVHLMAGSWRTRRALLRRKLEAMSNSWVRRTLRRKTQRAVRDNLGSPVRIAVTLL